MDACRNLEMTRLLASLAIARAITVEPAVSTKAVTLAVHASALTCLRMWRPSRSDTGASSPKEQQYIRSRTSSREISSARHHWAAHKAKKASAVFELFSPPNIRCNAGKKTSKETEH
jgi:hypothetical protein